MKEINLGSDLPDDFSVTYVSVYEALNNPGDIVQICIIFIDMAKKLEINKVNIYKLNPITAIVLTTLSKYLYPELKVEIINNS